MSLKHINNYFTLEEWSLIDDALDALLIDLRESALPSSRHLLKRYVWPMIWTSAKRKNYMPI